MFDQTPPKDAIDRVSGLPHRESVRRYLTPERPVAISHATRHWDAIGRSEYSCVRVQLTGYRLGLCLGERLLQRDCGSLCVEEVEMSPHRPVPLDESGFGPRSVRPS